MEGLKIDDLEEGAPDFTGQSLTATSIPALYNADSKVWLSMQAGPWCLLSAMKARLPRL